MVKGKLTSWEDKFSLVQFAYNRVIHSTIGMSPFEAVYGFNPLTPLDLTPLFQDVVLSLDGNKRAESMKKLHEKVWVHFRKERFPNKRNTKLIPREDGPFEVLELLNDNSYKIDLPPEYQVHNTLNACDLSPMDVDDGDPLNLRTNSFQEGENDTIQVASRPFTRIQARELQALRRLFMKRDTLEYTLEPSRGFQVLMIAWEDGMEKSEEYGYAYKEANT
ncbi:uncharacterized protein LOC132063495 [Lycium ferocissimum]|uniref:uncharacterized protein LOC132063495 n=1 Tax=Lycium ferocissimum TaxID=112874 RepID=UPI002814DE82|nr:uncharacterized protein LOC132063495 [Lycium ferocissimum]